MSYVPLKPVSPTQTLEITSTLSLLPRIKLLLTINRSDLSVTPIDEWQLKRSLLDFLKTSLSIPHIIPEEDIILHKFQDIKKRKREDPVANGVLYIRDLGFLSRNKFNKKGSEEEEDVGVMEERFLEWRDSFVKRLDGIELSLKGVKFKLSAEVPEFDDFRRVKKSWEELYAFSNAGGSISRGGRQHQPDTLVIRGLPSRWFAEPRVSSKPSMLVTHTIFSVFGKIRNLNVASDDLGENVEEGSDIVSGLQCKIVVQFEKHEDFSNALKLLCGRSMQKHGSRLRADYEATWDRSDFFRTSLQRTTRNQIPERNHTQSIVKRQYENETQRFRSHGTRFDSSDAHSKRFKE